MFFFNEKGIYNMIQHHMLKHFLFLQISVLQLYTAPHGYQEEPEISGRNFWISGRLDGHGRLRRGEHPGAPVPL